MTDIYIIYLALAVFSSLVSSLFGLGAALILLSVGAYMFPPAEAIGLATILFVSNTVARSITFWRDIPWRLGIFMAAVSVPFAYFGAQHLALLPTDILRKMLGGIILLHVVISVFHIRLNVPLNYPVFGVLSGAYGYLSGLLGTGNPIKAVFFHHMGLSKHAFVGMMSMTAVPANIVKLTTYYQLGMMDTVPDYMPYALVGISVLVAIFGRYLLNRMPDAGFQKGLQVMLAIVALGLIFDLP